VPVYFSERDLPLSVIYDTLYQNVSHQVLEIDKEIVPPGHLWSRMHADAYLVGDDYDERGYITQVLIRQGYIAKRVYTPIIPAGYLYLQSYESQQWFQIFAVEVDVDETKIDTRGDTSFESNPIAYPPPNSIIDFDVSLPYGVWFTLDLLYQITRAQTGYALGCTVQTKSGVVDAGDPAFYFEKKDRLHFPPINVPLSIPNTQELRFIAESGITYLLRINDEGQLFWTLYTGLYADGLFEPDELFWKATEPVLEMIDDGYSVHHVLEGGLHIQAVFVGTFKGLNGHQGPIKFEYRREDVAEIEPGFYPITSTSPNGTFSVTGTLTVAP
jgi:hypothetical protein